MRLLTVMLIAILAGCNETSEERLVKQRAACLELGGQWEYPAWFPCTYKKADHSRHAGH